MSKPINLSREHLGRLTGLILFAIFTGRQLLPPNWGGVLPVQGDLLTILRWLLVTLLFILFFHAYLIRQPAIALADRPLEILLPLICAPLPLVVMLINQQFFQNGPFWQWILHHPGGIEWFALIRQTPHQITTGLLIMAGGEALTVWGLWRLRASFSIFTEVRALVLTGPYKWLRHPLYTGEILSSWGYAIAVPNRLTLGGSLLFSALQIWRASLEENKLLQHHPNYRHYQQTTGFLLPKGLFLIVIIASQIAHADAENPLSYRPLPPLPEPQTQESNGLTQWLLFPLSVYSNTISRVDGDRCPSYPNCSHYAKEALQRHGIIPGVWLMIDRLIHEQTEIHSEARIQLKNGSLRIPDTLDSNDFWLRDPFQPKQENP
ncbi:MAG: membrane protein insertion efficiency factor YidD [Magnetococcales bacterium]|nr:membrane protein insertion efficiency factor YidD [Magnetococcales bacterium]